MRLEMLGPDSAGEPLSAKEAIERHAPWGEEPTRASSALPIEGVTTFPRVGAWPWHGRGQGFNSPQLHQVRGHFAPRR
jgi:hypothetical protein